MDENLRRPLLALALVGFALLGHDEAAGKTLEEKLFAAPLDPIPKRRAAPSPEPVDSDLRPSAILLITLDTTRADHLGTYGYDAPTSPALDRLAAEGVRAATAITPMPTTDPAHLSILTGLHPRTHGVVRNGIPLQAGTPSLSAWARSRGYHTAACVTRAHLKPLSLNLEGFDHESGPEEGEDVRDGRLAVEDALDWLDAHGREPFFLWVHFFEPHRPYRPTRELAEKWVPRELLLESPGHRSKTGSYTDSQIRANVARYDAEINYMDGLVDLLVSHVRGLRVKEDPPLIVVAADHGEAMGELLERHGFAFDHGKYLYQGVTRVPLFLVWPGHIPAGRVIEGPVQLTDLAATIFDLAGDEGFATQGESLVPLFRGEARGERRAFTERRYLPQAKIEEMKLRGTRQYAVQDGRYKLILSLPQEHVELLDLRSDPEEQRDLSEALPEVRDRLKRALEEWMAETPLPEEMSVEVPVEKREALRALGYLD